MKPAIDFYSYHRYFGEIYPKIETDPGFRMSVDDALNCASSLQVAGVSLVILLLSGYVDERSRSPAAEA